MIGSSRLKPLHSVHVCSMKSHSSSTMKLKTLVRNFIWAHLCCVARALSRAKSILIEVPEKFHFNRFREPIKKRKKKKLFLGSFRLHYNWSSSHVLPVPSPMLDGFPTSHEYYDSTWNSLISTGRADEIAESQLSGYLHWLEQKAHKDSTTTDNVNEIDRLADMFIASCHEKFMLEKQESYRRFQEMMDRSL